MSLCFESPFIRLEKLWIGALLEAVMPAKSRSGKQNGKVHEHQTVRVLDDIIERLEKEESRPAETNYELADEKRENTTFLEQLKPEILGAEIGSTLDEDLDPNSKSVVEVHVEVEPPAYSEVNKA